MDSSDASLQTWKIINYCLTTIDVVGLIFTLHTTINVFKNRTWLVISLYVAQIVAILAILSNIGLSLNLTPEVLRLFVLLTMNFICIATFAGVSSVLIRFKEFTFAVHWGKGRIVQFLGHYMSYILGFLLVANFIRCMAYLWLRSEVIPLPYPLYWGSFVFFAYSGIVDLGCATTMAWFVLKNRPKRSSVRRHFRLHSRLIATILSMYISFFIAATFGAISKDFSDIGNQLTTTIIGIYFIASVSFLIVFRTAFLQKKQITSKVISGLTNVSFNRPSGN
jgi:hypothetical protein